MPAYEFSYSWNALLAPGRSGSFFRGSHSPCRGGHAIGFHVDTAWWLAECARLIYVRDEPGRPTRRDHLRAVGGEELRFLSIGGTEASVLRLPSAHGVPVHVLAFRGTHDLRDWLSNIDVRPAAWVGGGLVHRGFIEALDRVWAPLCETLDDITHAGGPVLYTGHSLGGALATLAAAWRPPAAMYTFGAPRVGDAAFASALRDVPYHRVVNDRDLVPWVPTPGPKIRFKHAGRLCRLTRDGRIRHSYSIAGRDALMQVRDYLSALTDRRPGDAPPALADHALINYLARLDRLRSGKGS